MSLQNQKTSDAFGQYFDVPVLCEKNGPVCQRRLSSV